MNHTRQFYSLRTREEAEECADAMLEVLKGQKYIWAESQDNISDSLRICRGVHHLEEDSPFRIHVYDTMISLHMLDSYGIHMFESDVLKYIYISRGEGRISVRGWRSNWIPENERQMFSKEFVVIDPAYFRED